MKKLLGMPILAIVIGLVMMGGAMAALLSVYVNIQSTADVQQSVTWEDGETTTKTFSFSSVDAGSKTMDVFTLQNNVGVEAKYEFETLCDNRDFISSNARSSKNTMVEWLEQCEGITTRYVEYFDEAGVHEYSVPDCDVNVSEDIQDAINDANVNDVVCVEAGNYDGFIVNKPLTLVAIGEVIVDGTSVGSTSAMVQVAASGVTIEGFVIDSKDKNYALENTGNSDNMVLRNNEFIGNTHGVYINPSKAALIENNVFDVEGVAIGSHGHTGTIVRYNVFTENVGVETMGASGDYDVDFEYNNVYTDAPFNAGSTSNFNAENNYFAKGIVDGVDNADYMTKTDTTLDAGKTDTFGVINTFAINLAPGDYTLRTDIVPDVE